jgi:hypothetical protein
VTPTTTTVGHPSTPFSLSFMNALLAPVFVYSSIHLHVLSNRRQSAS